MPGATLLWINLNLGGGTPPAATLADALRAYLLASLPDLTACYRRQTGRNAVYPYAVVNVLGEYPEWNDSGVDYPAAFDAQFTFVSDDDGAAESLRDAAYRLFTPRRNGAGGAANPGFSSDDGAVPAFGSLPGRKWELRQNGKGPGGQPPWLFAFQARFLVTRLM